MFFCETAKRPPTRGGRAAAPDGWSVTTASRTGPPEESTTRTVSGAAAKGAARPRPAARIISPRTAKSLILRGKPGRFRAWLPAHSQFGLALRLALARHEAKRLPIFAAAGDVEQLYQRGEAA